MSEPVRSKMRADRLEIVVSPYRTTAGELTQRAGYTLVLRPAANQVYEAGEAWVEGEIRVKAHEAFELGRDYYVTFTPVDPAPSGEAAHAG